MALFGLTSCDSYFDVNLEDQATMEEIFSKSTTTRQYLAHCYSFIPQDERPNNYEGGVVTRSDEALFGSSSNPTVWYKFRQGDYSSATPTSIQNGNFWAKYYKGIAQCTTFMENVHLDLEDSEELRNVMAAEARFLRAFYYFCLFRHYGPVIVWGDQPADQNAVGKELDRDPLEKNINFIVDELDKVIPILPENITEIGLEAKTNFGRVTKGAARALKARVLIYAASPLYNGCDLYKGMTNMNGEKIFPQEYDANKWEVAAQACLDVINMSQYSLVKSEKAGNTDFQNKALSYQNVYFEPWNTETIWGWWFRNWDFQYSEPNWLGSVGGYLSSCVPREITYQGYQLITPSLKLVDAYPMAESGRYPMVYGYDGKFRYDYDMDGKGKNLSRPNVDPASGYQAEGWTENYQQQIDVDPSWAKPIKVHSSTVGRDPRYYACLVPNGFWWPNKVTMKSENGQLFTCYNSNEATSKWMTSGEVNRIGYSWRRIYESGNPLKVSSDYISKTYVFPAFRLAEVYLNYAEACNEKPERNEAEALKYVNLVRERVGLNKLEEAYPEVKGDKELLRHLIRMEKMVEFGMEGGMRWYDATRTMIAKDEFPADTWTLHVSATTYEESYERVNNDHQDNATVFTDRDYLLPIASAQLAEMVNYTQNYGH